ncbi:MAG: protein of unknown function transrane [Bacillota bacterium]|nr:protein of unknown function transrane [Bacillota bacterium]
MEKSILINKIKPYIAYFNICILWGTSSLVSKIGLGDLNISVLAFMRCMIAGFLMLAISLIFKMQFPKKLSEWKIVANISVLMNFVTIGFVAFGSKYADSGIVTLILATVPIFTTIIECFILKIYNISIKGIIGLSVGFIGIVIILFYGSSSVKADLTGIFCALFGAITWSIGSVYSKIKPVEGPVIAQTAVEFLFASVLFFIAGNITNDFVISNITFKSLIPVFYLAIVDSFIGFTSYIYLLKIWKPSKVATYAYINPAVALIFGAIILGEYITTGKIIGMIIIVISVILIQNDKTVIINKIEELEKIDITT